MKPKQRSPFYRSRKIALFSSLLLVLAVSTGIYFSWFSAPVEATTPTLQTSRVRNGDIVISVSGAGSLLPAAQVDLGFRTQGVVAEVLVAPGQEVNQGDLLARLDDYAQKLAFAQAEANLKALFTPESIAGFMAEASSAQISYEEARLKLEELETVEEGQEATPETDLVLARSRLAKATLVLEDANQALAVVQAGPEKLDLALEAADGTALARLRQVYLAYENSRIALDNTRLVAPFDGTVVNLKLVIGQTANTSPTLTLATLDDLQVKFYVDETDLSGASVGNKVIYTFNAFPDSPVQGRITQIEGALQTIDGSPKVVVWGSLEEQPAFPLLAGMTVEVEVIAGEAYGVLLLPIQALREVSPDAYTVFVVQEDGSLKLSPVSIGLADFANAQVLSGLQAGDVVSTGTVETR